MVLGLNIGFSQDISYWCIIKICIVFQAQSLIVPNVSKKCTNPSKCTLSVFSENVSNLCNEKLNSTLVDKSGLEFCSTQVGKVFKNRGKVHVEVLVHFLDTLGTTRLWA